ncbi:MAG TPA: acyl carrier protein [Enhygromyxa sp.]|nr:acyl carrier protein [Enhygromyxa sp.]
MKPHTSFTLVRDVIAAQARRPRDSLKPETELAHELGLDSLAMIEINVALEEQLGVRLIDFANVPELVTLADVVRFVEAKVQTGVLS